MFASVYQVKKAKIMAFIRQDHQYIGPSLMEADSVLI